MLLLLPVQARRSEYKHTRCGKWARLYFIDNWSISGRSERSELLSLTLHCQLIHPVAGPDLLVFWWSCSSEGMRSPKPPISPGNSIRIITSIQGRAKLLFLSSHCSDFIWTSFGAMIPLRTSKCQLFNCLTVCSSVAKQVQVSHYLLHSAVLHSLYGVRQMGSSGNGQTSGSSLICQTWIKRWRCLWSHQSPMASVPSPFATCMGIND